MVRTMSSSGGRKTKILIPYHVHTQRYNIYTNFTLSWFKYFFKNYIATINRVRNNYDIMNGYIYIYFLSILIIYRISTQVQRRGINHKGTFHRYFREEHDPRYHEHEVFLPSLNLTKTAFVVTTNGNLNREDSENNRKQN